MQKNAVETLLLIHRVTILGDRSRIAIGRSYMPTML